MLVTHATSHERGLQIPMPAQGNIALREKQGRKEQPVLAGREGLTVPGSSREHSPVAACQPSGMSHSAWGSCSSAALQPQGDVQASGYHQGWMPGRSHTSRFRHLQGSVGLSALAGVSPWLWGSPASFSSRAAASVLAGQRVGAEKEPS